MLLRALVLTVLLAFSFITPSVADEGSRVILVLDASGSMRAKIDGKTKIAIAKEVVGKIISTWNPADELGLIAYGHREKGNCKDIEVLREPGPLNPADFMTAVNSLQPKGQTPMTDAVRMAAKALQYTEKKATVILVSDGIENCQADPCAVADELKSLGVGLTVHTVGFGLDNKGAIAQLKCLADKTGGTFSTADNEADLQKALAQTIAAKPAEPPPSQFNVVGHVKQTGTIELSKPFLEPVWSFYKPDLADGTRGEFVTENYNVDMKTKLPPGDYVAVVKTGRAISTQAFKVESAKITRLDVVQNSGIVELSAMIDDKTPLSDKEAVWDLHTENGTFVDTTYGPVQQFMLNEGKYEVELRLGTVKVTKPFEIKAGETTKLVMSMGAGKAKISAVYSPGGEAMENGISFTVYKAGPSDDELGDELDTKYNAVSVFDLPAGKYVVAVKLGMGLTKQPFEIAAGQTAPIKINANMGFITAKSEGATSFEVKAGKKALDGSNASLGTSYDPVLNTAINAGNYLVQSYANGNLIAEKSVDVKAGERTEITLP